MVLVLLLFAVAASAQAPTAPSASPTTSRPAPEVPYVPTKEPVLDQMLDMAKIQPGDVLYDLGCGDGRIVIEAAKRYGIRGVGVDIDPERIREANDNARRAGVSHLVRFYEGDLFDTDLKEATVVTLYLLPDVNLRLRPKLLSELKPGTRVVSHNYDMGDWKPAGTRRLTVEGTEHVVYFWVVPPRAASR
jgi:SAM-dependent methyltransferase